MNKKSTHSVSSGNIFSAVYLKSDIQVLGGLLKFILQSHIKLHFCKYYFYFQFIFKLKSYFNIVAIIIIGTFFWL